MHAMRRALLRIADGTRPTRHAPYATAGTARPAHPQADRCEGIQGSGRTQRAGMGFRGNGRAAATAVSPVAGLLSALRDYSSHHSLR